MKNLLQFKGIDFHHSLCNSVLKGKGALKNSFGVKIMFAYYIFSSFLQFYFVKSQEAIFIYSFVLKFLLLIFTTKGI